MALQAATCEDFCRAMFDGSPLASLAPAMMRWYDTNGAPELTIKATYSPAKQTLNLTVTQELETAKAPLLIPLKVCGNQLAAGLGPSADCWLA
jgi:aminopeptidase N